MNSCTQSILDRGMDGIVIEAECQLSNGLPSILIVGLGNKAVDEAKERIRAAFTSSALPLPRKRITINLAPADIPKESTSLDLAIAVAILAASDNAKFHPNKEHAFIGEVSLNGTIRAVRGIIGKLLTGKKLGVTSFFIPADNLSQALLVPDIKLYPVESLQQIFRYLHQNEEMRPQITGSDQEPRDKTTTDNYEYGLSSIIGQERAKRALEIAAAGGHNVMLSGPPGTGKSMLAKALATILPPLSHPEMLEVTHLYSLASNHFEKLVTKRPFRAPHHSASHVSIVGGGNNAGPGEITLSHRGVLFLDEMPEFSRTTLEALRQPLEDRQVTIARAKQTLKYPANFMLIATANPCPCGYYGSNKSCQCTTAQIYHYQQKLSGPILDRIDLFVEVNAVKHAQLLSNSIDSTKDKEASQKVVQARRLQQARFGDQEALNSDMSNATIRKLAKLHPDSKTMLDRAAQQLDISARTYMRLIKIARTIADLENSSQILTPHISEALQFRNTKNLAQ